jgi:biotin operon repressor
MRYAPSAGLGLLLADVPPADAASAGELVHAAETVDVAPSVPYLATAFAGAALLVVDDGFVVLRAVSDSDGRSVITSDAGAGGIMLPPAGDEVLYALGPSRVTAVGSDTWDRLLTMPTVAQVLLEQLALTLRQTQQAIGILGQTRHVERVRRKLLQLACGYGHVVADGVRIDFPVSHTVLAAMIGSSRETVTRAVDELQRAGFVARRGHSYRLLVAPEAVLDAAWPRCDRDHEVASSPGGSIARPSGPTVVR